MRKEFAKITKELVTNKDYAVLLGDISVGLFVNADDNLPKNIFNLGVLEQSMISFAAGLSKGGIIPFVHTISPFMIERAYEQIKLDLVYNKNKAILVSANGPFDYTKLGPTHHCPSDVPLLDLLGDIKIYLPARIKDINYCISKSIKYDFSSYIRLNSHPSTLNDISDNEIHKKNDTHKKLNIYIGESLSHFEKKIINLKEDWVYIFDINQITIKDIDKYEEIFVWEPYSSPIFGIKIRNHLGMQVLIKSHIYPKYIYEGIFEKPEYEELIV